jgi:hypothetical protein
MSFHFTLQVVRIECLNEQLMEWGKDEMHLIGFGVSRKGRFFATGYRGLGSYGEGDVRTTSPLPMTLYESDLEDDELDVLFYFWLVEEDGGGVGRAASALEAEMRASYLRKAVELNDIQFPRVCIPFTAFYKAVLPFEASIAEASTDGRNDELYTPFDLLLRFDPNTPSSLSSSTDLPLRRSKHLGDYLITLRYTYRRDPPILA